MVRRCNCADLQINGQSIGSALTDIVDIADGIWPDDVTFLGGVVVGEATGGMPAAGVINAAGIKINGVDVSTSTDTFWNTATGGISYSAGHISVGVGATLNSSDAMISILRDVDDTGAGAGANGHAFSDSSDITRTGGVSYNSFDGRINIEGTADYGHYAAFQSAPTYGTSGTTTYHYGVFDGPTISAGTLSNRYAVYAADVTGLGAVTNNYGLYVPELLKGTTRNYALYTAGRTLSRFGGDVVLANADGTEGTGTSLYFSSGSGDTYEAGLTHSIQAGSARGDIGIKVRTAATAGAAGLSEVVSIYGGTAMGIAIKQGANSGQILSLESTSVTHGMTTDAPTNAYFTVQKSSSSAGGAFLRGYGEAGNGVSLWGQATTEDTTKTTGGRANIEIEGHLKSGTTSGAMGAGANILAIRNNTTTQFIVGVGGHTWQQGDIDAAQVFARSGVFPDVNDGAVLGTTNYGWSDLFLASGAVINWANGDVTLTHAADTLTLAGGGVVFSGAVTLSGGAVSYGANDSAGAGYRLVRVPNA
jgi:hypothetical protein